MNGISEFSFCFLTVRRKINIFLKHFQFRVDESVTSSTSAVTLTTRICQRFYKELADIEDLFFVIKKKIITNRF